MDLGVDGGVSSVSEIWCTRGGGAGRRGVAGTMIVGVAVRGGEEVRGGGANTRIPLNKVGMVTPGGVVRMGGAGRGLSPQNDPVGVAGGVAETGPSAYG